VLTSFFIEFRLRGFARQYAIWVEERIHREAKRLRLKHKRSKKFVSHVTLFGPAKTKNIKKVQFEVKKTCSKYTLVPFRVSGFGQFQNSDANWLYLGVIPTSVLEELRYELAQNLLKSDRTIHETCTNIDHALTTKFHSSINKSDPQNKAKFKQLYEYANLKCSIEEFNKHKASIFEKVLNIVKKLFVKEERGIDTINLHLLRITVIGKGHKIQFEYDLILKRILNRRQALSRYWSKRTIGEFRNLKAVS
jgi:hypothetical protein